jgi:hypothetical protein
VGRGSNSAAAATTTAAAGGTTAAIPRSGRRYRQRTSPK